jgi:hypothetical protein
MNIDRFSRILTKEMKIIPLDEKSSGCGDIRIYSPQGVLKQTLKISDEVQKSIDRVTKPKINVRKIK